MNKAVIDLLKNNNIIKVEEDFSVFELANANPFKSNIIGIFSKIKNKNYVIKKCERSEIKNLKYVKKLLLQGNVKKVKVLMPIDNAGDLFLFEDAGIPLNKKALLNQKKLFGDITNINNLFLRSGYFWGGLALRNIFYSNDEYTLIDFEKLFEIEKSNLSRRHLLFLRLNLVQSFDEKLVNEYINSLDGEYCFSNKMRKLDRVEKVGWKILSFKNKDEFFNYLDEATINAEKPLDKDTRPFKVGHIIDELASAEISFLWTLLMNEKRMQSASNFRQLLDSASEIIEFKNEKQAKFHLACLIIALGNIKKYIKTVKEMETIRMHNSSDKYDDILRNIVKAVCELANLSFKNINIIARGSYGECVLTNKSDLDFEIIEFKDNDTRPLISVEELVCEILNYLEIDAEGTSGRPTEKDVVVNGKSRDLFEIFELRLVSGSRTDFLKYLNEYKKMVYEKELWKKKTEYEEKVRVPGSKSIFEDARFLITRLAIMNNKKIVSSKIYEKLKMCPKNLRKELGVIIKEIIHMRNDGIEGLDKCQSLINAMNKIKVRYKLPIL